MKFSDFIILCLVIIAIFFCFMKSEINYNFCSDDNICINQLIESTQNISFCELNKNTSRKDNCYFINTMIHNTNYCNLIINNTIKDNCISQISKTNVNNCEQHSEPNECYFNLALQKQDISICNFANNTDYCIYSIAFNLNNQTLCNLSGEYKETCNNKFIH